MLFGFTRYRGGGGGPGHRGRRQRRRGQQPETATTCGSRFAAFLRSPSGSNSPSSSLPVAIARPIAPKVPTTLLRATVNLLMKQPSVIAGARSENANQAFFLLLSAEREGKQ